MTYRSVTPENMTNEELRSICGELFTAKNWGLSFIEVKVKVEGFNSLLPAVVLVESLPAYQKRYKTEGQPS